MARESGEPIVLAVGGASMKENEVMCGPLKVDCWIHIRWKCLGKARFAWTLLLWPGETHIGITIVKFIPENRMTEMLCVCDHTRPHTSVLITEALKKFG